MNEEARTLAKARIVEVVTGWVNGLADEAFFIADRNDSRVNWENLDEVADHICGCLAMHSQGEIVEEVEEILTEFHVAKVGN